jgi:DNA/RNA endonuclease G (NUC1)/V8-like Glu-specific endopeptidase
MGTGFLIQENLILTNRHVLQVSARLFNGTWKFSDGAAIDFGHEFHARDSINRRKLKRVVFSGDKPIDFSTIDHSKLDLALIELEPATPASRPIMVLPLKLTSNWAAPGRQIITIGYPGSPPTMLYPPTLLEQLFHATFGYKRIAPGELIASQMGVQPWTLTHDATTLGGNSGSIVLVGDQEQWAAGLHYGGRGIEPRENWGHVLASVLNATDGTSTKSLRDILRENGVRFLDDASAPEAGPIAPSPQAASHTVPKPPDTAQANSDKTPPKSIPQSPDGVSNYTLNFTGPVHFSVSIPALTLTAIGPSPTVAPIVSPPAGFALEKVEIDTDYNDREGYDPTFLGGGKRRVPLPIMKPVMIRDAARNLEPADGVAPYELPYHHYSVVLNSRRRLAFFTAVNIDGTLEKNLGKREKDKWIRDRRVESDLQIGDEWYAKPFDRGHLVRRLDPAWGRSAKIAKTANDDTFHFTNCSPQHSSFNQGKSLWQGLENYLLDTANNEERRISVFTGPIFTDDDPVHDNVQVPKRFWKVAAFVRTDGSMGAAGFIVSQEELLASMGLEATAEQVARTFQERISVIERLTSLDFGVLRTVDTLQGAGLLEGVEAPPVELTSFEQIKL